MSDAFGSFDDDPETHGNTFPYPSDDDDLEEQARTEYLQHTPVASRVSRPKPTSSLRREDSGEPDPLTELRERLASQAVDAIEPHVTDRASALALWGSLIADPKFVSAVIALRALQQ